MDTQTAPSPAAAMASAIRNPANYDHMMFVQQVRGRIAIDVDGKRIADSINALRVIEIGNSVYEPRYYIPNDDVTAKLEPLDKTTHCPIKGEARYYTLNGKELAWRYDTFDFADILEGHLSFDAGNLTITHKT